MLQKLNEERTLVWFGGAIFLFAAVLGWLKLPYGFNFIDEGMYMADAWRMTVGDSLFPNNAMIVVRFYAVFNAAVFQLFPDISLLGFRQLQFILTILVVGLMGLALFRLTKSWWPALLGGAVFAFTGLDPNGMAANLSYYSYPHLFIALHAAFALLALTALSTVGRLAFIVLAAASLWAAGLSALPLAATGAAYLVLLWPFNRETVEGGKLFEAREIALGFLVFAVLWIVFLAVYNVEFVRAASAYFEYASEGGEVAISIWGLTQFYVAAAGLLYILFHLGLTLDGGDRVVAAVAISALMFAAVWTDLFGLMPRFWNGWFPVQMWFSAFLIVLMLDFFTRLAWKRFRGKRPDRLEQAAVFVMVPAALMALIFTQASLLGGLATAFVAIPVTLMSVFLVVRRLELAKFSPGATAVVTAALFLPFHMNLAWADWNFTYFDLKPRHLTHTVETGFARGIKTNEIFHDMIVWMREQADIYSEDGDFALVAEQTAMGYMLIHRRPAINHSWTTLANSSALRKDAVNEMVRLGRDPKIAFLFNRAPLIFPASSGADEVTLAGTNSFKSGDPLVDYIGEHMEVVAGFRANGMVWITALARKDRPTKSGGGVTGVKEDP